MHLLDVLSASHDELKVTHEQHCASHEKLTENYYYLIEVF
jgi:hypothetical protein